VKYYRRPPKDHKKHERERIQTTDSVTKIQILGSSEIVSTTGIQARAQGASVSSPSTVVHLFLSTYSPTLQPFRCPDHSENPHKTSPLPLSTRHSIGHSHTQNGRERWVSNLGDISPLLMLRPSKLAISHFHSLLDPPHTGLHRCFSKQ
jgi:hypothetical protein